MKLKYSSSMMIDTLDLAIVGAYFGKGRRSGKYGAFLLACRDGDSLVAVSKVGSGFTDEMLDTLTKTLEVTKEQTCIAKQPPDVWVVPKVIVEVAAQDVTKTEAYPTGYSLRFPRVLRIRDDKNLNEITEAEVLARGWEALKNSLKR
jgi:DNA ligase-1